jgi:hypothetical protein
MQTHEILFPSLLSEGNKSLNNEELDTKSPLRSKELKEIDFLMLFREYI